MDIDSELPLPLGIDRQMLPVFVYLKLRKSTRHNRDLIVKERDSQDISLLGWLARNILELHVWIEYCSMSEENALEFYYDALRDMVDLDRTTPEPLDPATQAELETAKKDLPQTKQDHKYKAVREAAAEAGPEVQAMYDGSFKMLSKLAHPTAFSVMARGGPGTETLRQKIVLDSHTLAQESLFRLEWGLLGDTYRKYLSFLPAQIAED